MVLRYSDGQGMCQLLSCPLFTEVSFVFQGDLWCSQSAEHSLHSPSPQISQFLGEVLPLSLSDPLDIKSRYFDKTNEGGRKT